MNSPLFIMSILVGLVGAGCAVTGAVMARKRIRAALILNAVFLLLMGSSVQIRVWSDRLEDQRRDLHFGGEVKDIVIRSIAAARGASSPKAREEALKTAEEAVKLDTGGAAAGGIVSLGEILALGSIVLGSVTLILALTRPDLLTRRIAKPVAASVESRP